jgi:hypothetical protein
MEKYSSPPVSCRQVKRHVLEELDEKVRLRQFRTYKEHLDRCTDCHRYLTDLKRIVWYYKVRGTGNAPWKEPHKT